MTMETLILSLPEAIYDQLRQRAAQTQRTVEVEAREVLIAAVPIADALPTEIEQQLQSLAVLDDEALWQAARVRFPPSAARRLESLHLKQQREGLTEAERQTTDLLVHQYERAMLVRAQAAVLLKERGHNITSLRQRL